MQRTLQEDAQAPRLRRVRELGRGATGLVELCVLEAPLKSQTGRVWPAGAEVALKTLHPELAEAPWASEALRSEAEASRAVRDPSLVEVLWHGQGPHGPLLVMRYVPGRSLREILVQDGPLPEPLLRTVGAQLAGALAALHAAGLVHGDLKPENIRLDEAGLAVLVDLGFARRLADPELHSRTQTGSLPYLSPERAQGGPASRESDVFALGVALYELATGAHPFDESQHARTGRASRTLRAPALAGLSTGALLRRSLDAPGADRLLASLVVARYAPASRLVPQLSPLLDELLEELLARDAERRPTAAEMGRRLSEGEGSEWWRARRDGDPRATVGGPGRGEEAHLTPLVGRERELAQLLEHYELACGRAGPEPSRGALVWISGIEGCGKSRLVTALAARARRLPLAPVFLYARCSELEESRPGGALLMLLSRWLRLPEGTPCGQRERDLLERSVPPRDALTLIEALDPTTTEQDSGSVALALAGWLAGVSRELPLIVFLDDLHEAGASTVEALTRLLERIGGARILLLLGSRGQEDAPSLPAGLRERLVGLPGTPAVLHLSLEALSESDVRELVTRLFHHSAPRLRLTHVLWQRSRGNPGLLAEILRTLLARGQARPFGAQDERLLLDIAPEQLPQPSSLAKLIQRRYRELSSEDKLWLGRLAVVGGRITPDFLLRAFAPASRPEVDLVLTRLTRLGWITPAGPRYRFARPALREAIYRSLPPGRARRIHAAAARALAPEPGSNLLAPEAFQRAWHLRAAGQHAALARAIQPLIRALARHGETERVHMLAMWGLKALESLASSPAHQRLRVELLGHAADAANRLGRRTHERELLDQLAELALDPEQSPLESSRVYLLHGRYAAGTGQFGLARGMLRNAVELARAAGGRALLSESLRRLALVQSQVGELAEARELAREARSTAQGDVQVALSRLAMGTLHVLAAELEPALREVDQVLLSLRSSRGRERPLPQCVAQLLRARVWRSAGRPGRALGAASLALDLAQRAGERRLEGEAAARQGGLLLELDRTEEAESSLREALLLADEIEDRHGQALARLFLAILLWERDDPEASRAIDGAVELARELGYARAEALALAIRARVERAGGGYARARTLSQESLRLLERHGAELPDRIVIGATHALVLESAGEGPHARAVLAELERHVRRSAEGIQNPTLRVGVLDYSRRLLDAASSPEGPVYPRTGAGTG